jgi:hypothetical protein
LFAALLQGYFGPLKASDVQESADDFLHFSVGAQNGTAGFPNPDGLAVSPDKPGLLDDAAAGEQGCLHPVPLGFVFRLQKVSPVIRVLLKNIAG